MSPERLRERAALCRRLAEAAGAVDSAARLRVLADLYEETAQQLEGKRNSELRGQVKASTGDIGGRL